MGWFSSLLFGDAGRTTPPSNSVLPKKVDQWGQTSIHSSRYEITEEQASVVEPRIDSVEATRTTPSYQKKIVPELEVTRLEPHLDSAETHLELWAHLRNHSEAEIEVRHVELLKQRIDERRFLKPEEEHEVRVYAGSIPKDNAEKYALIRYRVVETDDYFEAKYLIKYHIESDDHFVPEALELIRPVRDI